MSVELCLETTLSFLSARNTASSTGAATGVHQLSPLPLWSPSACLSEATVSPARCCCPSSRAVLSLRRERTTWQLVKMQIPGHVPVPRDLGCLVYVGVQEMEFFFFWPCHVACGILVPRPDQGSNPCPLHCKGGVLTTGPPGNSQGNGIFNKQS